MSGLHRNGLSLPMALIMAAEFEASGHVSTGMFQGLSGGNISSADKMASAASELNRAGSRIAGISAAFNRASRSLSTMTPGDSATTVTHRDMAVRQKRYRIVDYSRVTCMH